MLTAVLTGLFLGGWLSAALFREERAVSPLTTSLLLLLGSLALVWQKTLWDGVPHSFAVWGGNLTEFWQGELLRLLQALRLLLPPSILLGMVFPSLFRMDLFPDRDRARLAAWLGGVNAVGCVLGALLCGFWLIPRFGSESTLTALGVVALACGWALALAYGSRRAVAVGSVAAALVAVAWGAAPPWNRLALTSGEHVYFGPSHVQPGSQLLSFHEDTLGGITTVVREPAASNPGGDAAAGSGTKTLLTNGKFQASDGGEMEAQTGFAIVPLLHVAERRDALVIGLGSGHSASLVRRFDFSSIDVAEISPGIVAAARQQFAHINDRILDQPGVHLHLEDGRNLLLLSPKRYDLITMEISSIWFSGSTNLYSREFYELCRRRLKPGGIMQQWIQVHHIGIEELGAVIVTMREIFPEVSFWVIGGQGILVGSVEPQRVRSEALETSLRIDPWGDRDAAAVARRLVLTLAGRLLAPVDVTRLQSSGIFEINTDRNRYLEYATPRYNLVKLPLEAINLRLLSRFSSFALPTPNSAWPEAVRASVRRLTPELQRSVLGIGPPPDAGRAR
jgi:spermidine synthase